MSAESRNPLRRKTVAMRPWDWSFPPPPVSHREVISAQPAEPTGRPPLLMVHGLAHAAWCFGEHWVPAAAEAGFPSYAVSLRGHGGSAGARHLKRTTTRDYVHDVLQAITELPEPPVLIGHSNGALVAQLVAERYPLRGLVLLTPAPMHSAVGDLVAIGKDRPADLLRAVVGQTLSMEPDILFEGLDPQTARTYSDRTGPESPLVQWELLLRRRVGPIRCPVLVIGTPADRLIRPADVQRTADTYGVEPVWFPGMGHDVMLDAGWDGVLETVLAFVSDLPGLGIGPGPVTDASDRIDAAGLLDLWESGGTPERLEVKAAVKASLAALVQAAPGHAVEVRVPPFAAVQAIEGSRHRRGTPPAVVECDARTWLSLAAGRLAWADAVGDGRVRASGERSDLSAYLPLIGTPR